MITKRLHCLWYLVSLTILELRIALRFYYFCKLLPSKDLVIFYNVQTTKLTFVRKKKRKNCVSKSYNTTQVQIISDTKYHKWWTCDKCKVPIDLSHQFHKNGVCLTTTFPSHYTSLYGDWNTVRTWALCRLKLGEESGTTDKVMKLPPQMPPFCVYI